VQDYDKDISRALNRNMCTVACPCFKSAVAFEHYNSIPEIGLNSFGRTNQNTKDMIPIVWTDDPKNSFTTLSDCYHFLKLHQNDAEYQALVSKFDFNSIDLSETSISLLKFVESNF
jgi:hypothetical protein